MFISTLLIIPWIIFGFKNPDTNFIGLNQTRKSILTLLIIELAFFILLILILDKPDPDIAGQGSFAWTYAFFYEKGIFPCFTIAELINPTLGDRIDNSYQILYLATALIMDYVILKVLSPKLFRRKRFIVEK